MITAILIAIGAVIFDVAVTATIFAAVNHWGNKP